MLSNGQIASQIKNLESLYKSFQQLYSKVDFQYDQQKVLNLQVQKRHIELIQTRDILSHKITHILERISIQIRENISNKYIHLQTVTSKHQCKNNNKQMIIQNQYYFKLPSLRFHINNMQVPDPIQTVVEQFDNQYQTDKNNIQNQITKLKILIKLAQMNQNDFTTKLSKTPKNL